MKELGKTMFNDTKSTDYSYYYKATSLNPNYQEASTSVPSRKDEAIIITTRPEIITVRVYE